MPAVGCQPGNAPAANLGFGMGIYRVQLAGLDTATSGAAEGYQDYGCRARAARLQRGGSYTLAVQTNANADETVRAWLDYNNDGQFTAAELVLASTGRQHAAVFAVPTTAQVNVRLRLRIAADYSNAPVPTPCSAPQYSQTEDYRVVLLATAPPRPQVQFTALDTVSCGTALSFRDQSMNTPTQWRWDFGDGQTSTQQHPQHVYAQPSTYTVKLRACNATGCDSLVRMGYIIVRADSPRPAACLPVTTDYCCGFGLTRVQLAGIDQRSADGQAGYQDFSCSQRAMLTADRPYTLQLTTGAVAHDVRVYLDLNDDGQFTAPTELLYQGLGTQSSAVPVLIPATTAGLIYQRPLRLRIWADASGSGLVGPCANPQRGQAEDYSVVVLPNATPPATSFAVNYQRLCGPVLVSFSNQTTGGATAHTWDFGDGTTSTLTVPPAHTYTRPGTYEVVLKASNAYGSDSSRTLIVVAANCPSYCQSAGTAGSPSSPAYFTRVQLPGLDNQDTRPRGVGYLDYTAHYAQGQQGQVFQLQAESPAWGPSSPRPWVRVTAWADYNQDGVFTARELIGTISGVSPFVFSARVPAAATLGATRLRLQIVSLFQPSDADNSCLPAFQTASTEDYSLLVLPASTPPVAGFAADAQSSCSGIVQFSDTSTAGPRNWLWSFGDGNTSRLQHPQHAYAAPGRYAVSLRVDNQQGSSTVVRPDWVTVSAVGQGPRPAQCLPPSGADLVTFGWGINQIQLGSWAYANPQRYAAYRDESCTVSEAVLPANTPTAFTVTEQLGFPIHVIAWLDCNDDGAFDPITERIYSSIASGNAIANPKVGIITAPSNAMRNRPLRLRVWWMSDAATSPATDNGPCYRHEARGQVRDFTVRITAPLANSAARPAKSLLTGFPNPASTTLYLHSAVARQVTLRLIDALGRCVWTKTKQLSPATPIALDMSGLPGGVYSLIDESTRNVQRIIIQH